MFLVGDFVAHVKFTVLLMPNGSDKITGQSLQEFQPTKVLEDPEIKTWLAMATKSKKKGGGKKKKGEYHLSFLHSFNRGRTWSTELNSCLQKVKF